MATTKVEALAAMYAQQHVRLEAALAGRKDAFQTTPSNFVLAVNPIQDSDSFEFSTIEWAMEAEGVVVSRADAEALRDWLITALA